MNTNLVWNSQNSLYLQIFCPFHNNNVPNFRPLLCTVHSIALQKCGLLNGHILIKFTQDCIHPDYFHAVINAEMLTDTVQLVHTFIMHSHPPLSNSHLNIVKNLTPKVIDSADSVIYTSCSLLPPLISKVFPV